MNSTRAEVEERGFAILPFRFLQDEMQWLIRDLEGSRLRRSKAGVRHALCHEAIRNLAVDPRLLNVAQEIVGNEATAFRATLFDKSPQANWLVVWHQDTALPLRLRRDAPGWGPWSIKEGVAYAHAPATALSKVIALRVHLDDSNEGNGPLKVLPGTHRRGVLSDEEIEHLVQQIPAVDCLVPQGGVLAMSPLIVHGSSKTQSQVPRRVIHIEYAACGSFDPDLQLATT